MKKDKNSLIYRMKGFAIWGVAVIHAATLSSHAAANSRAVLWHDFLPILSDIGVPIFFFLLASWIIRSLLKASGANGCHTSLFPGWL